MMKLLVNKTYVPTSSEDGETLDELLDSLRKRGEIAPDEAVVGLQGVTDGGCHCDSLAVIHLVGCLDVKRDSAHVSFLSEQ